MRQKNREKGTPTIARQKKKYHFMYIDILYHKNRNKKPTPTHRALKLLRQNAQTAEGTLVLFPAFFFLY